VAKNRSLFNEACLLACYNYSVHCFWLMIMYRYHTRDKTAPLFFWTIYTGLVLPIGFSADDTSLWMFFVTSVFLLWHILRWGNSCIDSLGCLMSTDSAVTLEQVLGKTSRHYSRYCSMTCIYTSIACFVVRLTQAPDPVSLPGLLATQMMAYLCWCNVKH